MKKVGLCMVGTAARVLLGGGFLIGGLSNLTHQLWLFHLDFGVIGGWGFEVGIHFSHQQS